MAREKPKAGGEKGAPRSGSASRPAANRGIGGGLLLGFSTCGNSAGSSYVAPLHRLRGVTHQAGIAKWNFEPVGGAVNTNSDVITMAIAQEFAQDFWITVANYIGGRAAGDTFVWVHNECATTGLDNKTIIPNVTSVSIVLGTPS
jgi:hypothetical protein